MTRISRLILSSLVVLPFAAGVAQGKGQSKGQGKGQSKVEKQAKGGDTKAARSKTVGNAGRTVRASKPVKAERRAGRAVGRPNTAVVSELAGEVERSSKRSLGGARHGQRVARAAVARATTHGLASGAFLITPDDNRVRIRNRSGELLLDLDDTRDMGVWRVVTERDRGKRGAPSFCRSGSGHPVWGRQWCIEKGFGLGRDGDIQWARAIDPRDVIFRRPITTTELLTRELLLGLLGDNTFNRLAAHAVSLGLVEPLAGRWIGEPVGPRVLVVSSGGWPVAEVVDVDRDDRADMLVVGVRP